MRMTRSASPSWLRCSQFLMAGVVVLCCSTWWAGNILVAAQSDGDAQSGNIFGAFGPPIKTLPQYSEGTSHRQSVCDRQDQFARGEVSLKDALNGLELNPVLSFGTPEFFFPDTQTFGVNETYPGVLVFLLDEVARRAGFEWRNSYGVVGFPENGTTFDEQLIWAADKYDFVVGPFAHTIPRFEAGLSFPRGWFDYSIIMVGKKDDDDDGGTNLFSFLEPFSTAVWLAIVGSILFSAVIYFILETIDLPAEDERKHRHRVRENTYHAAMALTGQFTHIPMGRPATNVFSLSMAFFSLLLIAAYTANLASFLVVENAPSIEINTVSDAVEQGLRMCVWDSTTTEVYTRQTYPSAKLVTYASNVEMYQGIDEGKCDLILTEVSTWRGRRVMSATNPGCALEQKGQVEANFEGGFVTAVDHGTLCTSLIRDVLNVHFLEMHQDGFVEEELEKLEALVGDMRCAQIEEDEEEDGGGDDEAVQLDMDAMGGTFIVHGALSVLAVAIALVHRWHTVRLGKRPHFCAGRHGPSKRFSVEDAIEDAIEKVFDDENDVGIGQKEVDSSSTKSSSSNPGDRQGEQRLSVEELSEAVSRQNVQMEAMMMMLQEQSKLLRAQNDPSLRRRSNGGASNDKGSRSYNGVIGVNKRSLESTREEPKVSPQQFMW